jgi:translocation and assembly module TamA
VHEIYGDRAAGAGDTPSVSVEFPNLTSALPAFPSVSQVLLALTAAAVGCLATGALAAEEPTGTAPPAAASGNAKSDAALAYRVVVDAPPPLKEALERNVGLVRWQNYADMTDEILDRLMKEALDEARSAAAAEGYFSPEIRITIDRQASPASVSLVLVPGEPALIASVRVKVTGPAAVDTPLGTDAIARLTRDWRLPQNETFRQPAWNAAKNQALATLQASPYAAAKITRSEAAIDPDRRSADLAVEIDSGPPFRFGQLEISGLAKYPPPVARNFNTIQPGEPYSERALDAYVWRLNASGYFASVQAAIDPDTTHPDDATINVAVIEGPAKRLEGGVGYSTDVQFRANASYRDVNFDGRGLQLLTEARVETKSQTGSLRLSRPPNDAGWIGTFSVGAERTDIEELVTRTAFAGTRWQTVEADNQRAFSATYYLDEQEPSGAPRQSSHALYPEVERYWRRVDSLIAPTAGWIGVVHAGAGVPGLSSREFGRMLGRFSAWIPIDRSNEMQLRVEGGAVLAKGRDGIPSTLLFRTGGDNTVRGYEFESLGVHEGNATVPGRYYAVGSVDAIHWIGESWGLAAFLDAGNATDSLSGIHLALGYGMGARVRTPLGPFRLDLAYGQDVGRVRVHFSVGLTF